MKPISIESQTGEIASSEKDLDGEIRRERPHFGIMLAVDPPLVSMGSLDHFRT